MRKRLLYVPVFLVERLRALCKAKTWQIEAGIVLAVLLATALLSGKGLVEYLGVAAVFFSFMHAKIAEYMREAQEARRKELALPEDDPYLVSCYDRLPRYFYLKEACWFAYFILLGAYSALVGVFVFLLYQPWRRLWRSYHPR